MPSRKIENPPRTSYRWKPVSRNIRWLQKLWTPAFAGVTISYEFVTFGGGMMGGATGGSQEVLFMIMLMAPGTISSSAGRVPGCSPSISRRTRWSEAATTFCPGRDRYLADTLDPPQVEFGKVPEDRRDVHRADYGDIEETVVSHSMRCDKHPPPRDNVRWRWRC